MKPIILLIILQLCTWAATAQTLNYTDSFHQKQGWWKYYNEDKTSVVAEGKYINNKKEGVWTYRNPEGVKLSDVTHKNDEAIGIAQTYYPSGKLMEQGFWQNGRWVGNYLMYYENGNPAYNWNYGSEGVREGKQQYFYPNGTVYAEGTWEAGKKSGTFREYSDKGKLAYENIFTNGRLTSMAGHLSNAVAEKTPTTTNETTSENLTTKNTAKELEDKMFDGTGKFRMMKDGRLEKEGHFKNGKIIDGFFYYYDTTGKLVKTETIKGGKVSNVEYHK